MKKKRRQWLLVGFFAVAFLGVLLSGCGDDKEKRNDGINNSYRNYQRSPYCYNGSCDTGSNLANAEGGLHRSVLGVTQSAGQEIIMGLQFYKMGPNVQGSNFYHGPVQVEGRMLVKDLQGVSPYSCLRAGNYVLQTLSDGQWQYDSFYNLRVIAKGAGIEVILEFPSNYTVTSQGVIGPDNLRFDYKLQNPVYVNGNCSVIYFY